MNSYIERRLKEKAPDELSILKSQWNFDKELVPRALQAIVTTFPHYSMHDKSHSECILDNVTKLLGERAIDEMTFTDLWLLLEAAYYHDIGMIEINRYERKEEKCADTDNNNSVGRDACDLVPEFYYLILDS